jgi:DNA-binding cell septation regulator SpoVG
MKEKQMERASESVAENPLAEKPSSAISVESLRLSDHATIKAFVDVRMGGVVAKGFKIIQAPGQRAWVALPSRQYDAGDGKPRYEITVELSDSLKARVSAAVLAAWREAVANG